MSRPAGPALDGAIGVAEDRLLELQEAIVDDVESVETSDAVLGEVLDDDGRQIGATLEVRVEPGCREDVTERADAAGVDVLEVESIRSLDRSRPGRVAYTADVVRLTLGVLI